MNTSYTSKQKLNCCDYPELNRQIGVWVSDPFEHRGLNRLGVEVTYETISINTMEYGKCFVAPEELFTQVIANTKTVIEKLENTIEELNNHRLRLLFEYERLKGIQPVPQPQGT